MRPGARARGRLRALVIGAVALGAAAPGVARAQASRPGDALVGRPWVDQFLEPMYIGPRYSARADAHHVDIFEAQIAPHLFYFQFVETLLRAHPGWTGWNGWTMVFVPLLRLRMSSTDSDPVRTPSFNPQFATVQKLFTWGARPTRPNPRPSDWAWPTDGGWMGLLSVQYTIAHHSNGQEGCAFVNTGTTDPNCAPADFSHGPPPANTLNGSYGTNYETLAVFHKWFQLDRNLTERRAETVGVSWERYEGTALARFLPGGFDDAQPSRDLQRIFGKHRVTAEYEWEQALACGPFERGRARGAFTWISPASDVSWKYRAALDVAGIFRDVGGLGLFTRLFYGQDYYNIRLENVGFMAIFGLTWDTRGLQVFKPALPGISGGDAPAPSTLPPAAPAAPVPVTGGDETPPPVFDPRFDRVAPSVPPASPPPVPPGSP